MSRVDIVIRYIEVDFTQAPPSLGFRIMFVISKNSLYRGSLYRGSLYRAGCIAYILDDFTVPLAGT